MKILTHIGNYFIMLKLTFGKFTKWKILKQLILKDIDTLIIGSLGIVSFISFFVGGVVAIQTALNLENPLLPKNLIGFAARQSIILEFSPTILALILAGKIGSAVASEIGTMRITEQIDALEIMGVNSSSFLILPKIVASVFINPFLTIISMLVSIGGGYVIAMTTDIVSVEDYVYGIQLDFKPFHVGYALIKSAIFAFLITQNENWGVKDLGIVLLASLLPFGTFYVDWKYLKKGNK